ncbi:MAG: hypothetical protein OEZ51_07950, partial [Nitrospinota bacterium]|nr:hypothetical protein [Nitrospinota bacterium]
EGLPKEMELKGTGSTTSEIIIHAKQQGHLILWATGPLLDYIMHLPKSIPSTGSTKGEPSRPGSFESV